MLRTDCDLARLDAGRLLGDLPLFREARIADEDLEHEAVLLRFGQGVGPLLLDGVLRRQHEERVVEHVPHLPHRDLPLLHRLQQGRLRLGRGAIDLVGQHDVMEQRPGQEAELAVARRAVLLQDVGPGDVGRHQVGRELDAAEAHRQALGQRADHQRLGQAGNPFQQAMPPAEERDQKLIDDVGLADDHLSHLLADGVVGLVEFLDRLIDRRVLPRVGH